MIDCRFLKPTDTLLAPATADGVLGRVVYASQAGAPELINGIPTLPLHMYVNEDEGFAEIWHSGGSIQSGSYRKLVYAHNDEFLFCAGYIPESGQYAAATCETYLNVFELIGRLNFPSIFRIWNFIARINEDNDEGLEIYRDFCRGRAEAFAQGYASLHGLPAATGIGVSGSGVAFYLLSCRSNHPVHIENSRQMPAYHYPRRYGPKSPSFARATALSRIGQGHERGTLFISGTASILGHETVHQGDIVKQCEVAISNIEHLISAENLARHGLQARYTVHDLDHIKVYYRHKQDLPVVLDACRKAFHPDAEIRFMVADICRADLLVEIEGVICMR